MPLPSTPTDQKHRPLRDLRISVTDRCNFRCRYCMPRETFGAGFKYLDKERILSFEEIAKVAQAFASLGTKKLRLTGGEPLMRRDLVRLVAMLHELKVDLSMTSNGALLSEHVAQLKAAGLDRLTVSVDSLDPERFARITDSRLPLAQVLDGIAAAEAQGFSPIKINTVVRRDFNEDELVPIARYFAGRGNIVRFIEYMDVGESNGWQQQHVVPKSEIVARLDAALKLEPLEPNYPGEVAKRFRSPQLEGELGVIASVSEPFCGDCSRARLSAEGSLYTCLFASHGHDLRSLLRQGATPRELATHISGIWSKRNDRYSELRVSSRNAGRRSLRVEMSHIGG